MTFTYIYNMKYELGPIAIAIYLYQGVDGSICITNTGRHPAQVRVGNTWAYRLKVDNLYMYMVYNIFFHYFHVSLLLNNCQKAKASAFMSCEW